MWLKVAIIVLPFVFQTHVVSFWHTFFIEDNHLNAWKCLNFVYACVSACFSVHVRGSEYIPLLGSSADPDYSFFGASDFDL